MKSALLFLLGVSTTSAYALKQQVQPGKLLGPSYQTTSECSARPSFINESRTEILGSIDKLPSVGVLVAREAEYYVESTLGTPVKVHGYQSFLKSKSKAKIVCGNGAKGVHERFSVFAPTLIDTTVAQKVGSSLWQFQILADEDKFSVWNMKRPLATKNEQIESLLGKSNTKYRLFQLSHNEYELLVIQESKGSTQYLSVKYDAVSNIK